MAYTSYTRDGDTFRFTDPTTGETVPGQGPVAMQKAQQIDAMQAAPPPGPAPSPMGDLNEQYAAMQAAPDMRLAQAAPVGMGGGGNANPFTPRKSLSDVAGNLFGGFVNGDPEKLRQIQNANRLPGTPEIPKQQITLGDQDMTAPEPGAKPVPRSKLDFNEPGGGGGSGPRLYDQPVFGVPAGGAGGPVKTSELQTGRHTQGTVLPEGDKEALVGAEGSQMAGAQSVINAEQKRAELVAAATVDENRKLAREQQESQARMAQARAEYQTRVAAVDKLNQEVQNTGIHSYWENKSNGEKFVSAISVALGVLGAGFQGKGAGEAASLQILNRAMDDDINRQRANMENKRAGASRAESLLGRYHEALGDMQAAEAATRSAMLDAAGRRIDEIVKTTESPKIQANGQVALAAIQKEKAEEDARRDALVEARTYQTMRTGGGGGAATPSFAIDPKSVVPGPNGGDVWLQNASPDQAAKANEEIGHYNNIMGLTNRMKAYGSAWEHMSPDQRKAAASDAALLKGELAKVQGISLRGEGAKLLEAAEGGDPNAFFNFGRSGAVNEMERSVGAMRHDVYARHRAMPVTTGWQRNAKGTEYELRARPAGPVLQPQPILQETGKGPG